MRDITDRLRGLVPHCEDHADYTEDDLLILQSAKEIEKLREHIQDQRDANRLCFEYADTIEAAKKQVFEALDAAHYYIDASDRELEDKGITRDDALLMARELRAALGEKD